MGFRVETHILKAWFDGDRLARVMPMVPFCATKIREVNAVFLYMDLPLAIRRQPLSPEMQNAVPALMALCGALEEVGASDCINRTFAEFNLDLSELFDTTVLSFDSNDDRKDFCISSKSGTFEALHCKADDLEILSDGTHAQIHPLIMEDEEPGIDLSIFSDNTFLVHERNEVETNDANRIARSEIQAFLNTGRDIIDILLEDLEHDDETIIYRHQAQ